MSLAEIRVGVLFDNEKGLNDPRVVDPELFDILTQHSPEDSWVVREAVSRLNKIFPGFSTNGSVPDEYKPALLSFTVFRIVTEEQGEVCLPLIGGETRNGRQVRVETNLKKRREIGQRLEVLDRLQILVEKVFYERSGEFVKDNGSFPQQLKGLMDQIREG